MRPEIRYPLNGGYRLAETFELFYKFTFALIFNKTDDSDAVTLGKDADIVVHPDASAVHLQDRRIGRQHQDIHYSLIFRAKRKHARSARAIARSLKGSAKP